MFFLFIALLVGPIVASSYVKSIFEGNPSSTFYLFQPSGLNNNDTSGSTTGTAATAAATTAATTTGSNAKRMFLEYAF